MLSLKYIILSTFKLIVFAANFATLFLFFSIKLPAQELNYKHYTIEDGLPSSIIYDIVQDSNGIIWLGSEQGLCRFDGKVFNTFSRKEGLSGSSVIKLFKDFHGRIWLITFNGDISYLYNDIIINHPISDTLAEVVRPDFIDNFHLDTQNNIWLTTNKGDLIQIDLLLNEVKVIRDRHVDFNYNSLFFEKKQNGYIWGKSSKDKNKLFNGQLKLSVNHKAFFISLDRDYNEFPNKDFLQLKDSPDEYLISFNNTLFHVLGNKVKQSINFEAVINCIYQDRNNNIFICSGDNGILIYPGGNIDNEPLKYLDGKVIKKILHDREYNYWFLTENNGLYFVNSIQFNVYPEAKQKIFSMDIFKDKLYFSTYGNEIYSCSLQDNKILSFKPVILEKHSNDVIEDILCHTNSTLWVLKSKYFKVRRYGRNMPLDLVAYQYEILEIPGSSRVRTRLVDSMIFKQSKSLALSSYDAYREKNFNIFEDNKGKILFGQFQHLFKSNSGSYYFEGQKKELIKNRSTNIQATSMNEWVGTRAEGLVIYNKRGETYRINDSGENRLSSNMVKVIHINNDTSIWIGTNKGLDHIMLTDVNKFEYMIDRYSKFNGLPSYDINSIVKHNGRLWLGTANGIVSFNPAQLMKIKVPPTVRITKISINDKDTALLDYYDLIYHQKNLAINFEGISITNPDDVNYKYKLEGVDKDWVITSGTTVRYPLLFPGFYTFYLFAGDNDGNWTGKPITIKFKIQKHYTQTNAFIISVSIGGIILLTTSFLIILRYQRKRIETKRNLLLSEIKTLRSQMNPHFIFNSLNSIQEYIFNQEEDNVSTYLDSFAYLMRKILENSKYNTITLEEELETIKLYVDLERLRFKNSFNYSIQLDPLIKPDEIVVAPMMIQPYLENSICHGLALRNTKGKLELSIKIMDKKTILFTVADNGIGRQKSREINVKRKGHKSTAMQNIEERIILFNKINKTDLKVEIIDLYNNKTEPAGTKVKLYMPYQPIY